MDKTLRPGAVSTKRLQGEGEMADLCNCDVCLPDPNFVCSYTGEDESIMSVYVANAYRGHLILSPGGANGQIGGLLHQLQPQQHYSHMGIVVSDYDLVRHCTASPQRMSAEEYYSGSVLGVSAPVDGLNVDHVQYGWPGTITQSVEQIFYADRYGDSLTPPGQGGPYHGSDLVDKESATGKAYRIAAISFDDVIDGGQTFPALVVKPCHLLETPDVRAALDRVVDEASRIYAHYRFHCYVDGAIGDDPNDEGPAWSVLEAQPGWDAAGHKWVDWSDVNLVKWRQVPETTPAVCSSFVWQAVTNVNKVGHPKIVLDWAKTHDEALGDWNPACKRNLPPDWAGDVVDPYTLNGLYTYDEGELKRAASWLHDSLSDEIFTSLKESLASQGGVMKVISDLIDDAGRGAFIVAAEGGAAALIALLTAVAAPVGAVLGGALSIALAEQLIELLYDMPDDIANQICTSFAFDCHRGFPGDGNCVDADGNEIRDVDSSNWEDAPGTGRAVSPDNIHMFWDAPGPSAHGEIQNGIYGYNTPVQPVVAVVRRPRCEVLRSTGTATLQGQVRYRGQILIGAYVKVGCEHTTTELDLGYRLEVRSGGQFKVVARYEDPATGMVLYGERATGKPGDPPIAAGSTVPLDIDVTEPPACLRKVVVSGTVRVDDVYATGADHAEQAFNKVLYVQWGVPRFDEGSGSWICDDTDPAAAVRHSDVAQTGAGVGDANANLKIEISIDAQIQVAVKLTGTIEDLTAVRTATVARDATVPVPEFDLDTGGPFNDRAYFRNIVIQNLPASAI